MYLLCKLLSSSADVLNYRVCPHGLDLPFQKGSFPQTIENRNTSLFCQLPFKRPIGHNTHQFSNECMLELLLNLQCVKWAQHSTEIMWPLYRSGYLDTDGSIARFRIFWLVDDLVKVWNAEKRRERDSNPRSRFWRDTRFPVVHLRPTRSSLQRDAKIQNSKSKIQMIEIQMITIQNPGRIRVKKPDARRVLDFLIWFSRPR